MFLFVITNKRTAPSRGFQRHVRIEDGEQEKHLGAHPGSVLPKAFVICLLLEYSLHLCFYSSLVGMPSFHGVFPLGQGQAESVF